ncbi:MAG: molybdopterin-guanine dinucleotide biosynthesis protein B [Magnetococcales bacterium]|nr:molybdopterin-guanine dinucleotide biosynthesis protein B [Magnetococcales bacterium]
MSEQSVLPIMGFCAPSGTGKTTLMAQVINALSQMGVRVAAIKHGHHAADVDKAGKDSQRFRTAGANAVIFSGPERWFLIEELPQKKAPDLQQQVQLLRDLGGYDLILIEGYKNENHPKIAVVRKGVTKQTAFKNLSHIVAVAVDEAMEIWPDPPKGEEGWDQLPVLSLNAPAQVAQFIQDYFQRSDT